MKRIVLCFDGTWNKPEVHTNVYHFYESVINDGQKQLVKYIDGVGTHMYDRILGGIFGEGISDKIKEGYSYLVQQYELGDEIFILGFSRGAYAARSLVGLIRKVGLLSHVKAKTQNSWMNILGRDKGLIHSAYELYSRRDPSPDTDDAQTFRKQYSYYDVSGESTGDPVDTNPVKIKFLGVWDTVGALGIPTSILLSCGYANEDIREIKLKQFHDVKLSRLVENAFHALAIDEHRRDFEATLWEPREKPQQHVEQVWFVGAHTDVGGGEDSHYGTLSKIPLGWMQEKAHQCGLEFHKEKVVETTSNDSLTTIYDSYTTFINELFHGLNIRGNKPYYRDIGTTQYGSEIVHESANFRLNNDNQYCPQNPVGYYVDGRRENAKEGKL